MRPKVCVGYVTAMRLKHLGAMCLLTLVATACTAVSAQEPEGPGDPPATTVVAPVVVHSETVRDAGPIYCMDRTQHLPEVARVDTFDDGTTARVVLEASSCVPWPARCMDGRVFIPPSGWAGYQSQCLAYGKPLFMWWEREVFGAEAPTAWRVTECESHWKPGALGPPVGRKRARAIGLMQLLGWGGHELLDPHTNIVRAKWVRDHQGWDAWSCY